MNTSDHKFLRVEKTNKDFTDCDGITVRFPSDSLVVEELNVGTSGGNDYVAYADDYIDIDDGTPWMTDHTDDVDRVYGWNFDSSKTDTEFDSYL